MQPDFSHLQHCIPSSFQVLGSVLAKGNGAGSRPGRCMHAGRGVLRSVLSGSVRAKRREEDESVVVLRRRINHHQSSDRPSGSLLGAEVASSISSLDVLPTPICTWSAVHCLITSSAYLLLLRLAWTCRFMPPPWHCLLLSSTQLKSC
jgi:hypothetical protein